MTKGIILLFLLSSLIPLVSSGTFSFNMTIYVDDDNTAGPWDGTTEHPYQHIQDGIDNSQVDNTIFVKKGIYYENIFVNKTITLQGEENHYTIIDGQGNRDVIYVGYPANGVTISGFTIRNAGKRYGNGIFDGGIDLNSDENTIKNNIFIKNKIAGLILFGSSKNIIENNYIGDSNRSGIEFISGRFNQISNNTITNNTDYGICVSSMGNSSKNVFSIIHNNFLNNYVRHASCPFNIWTFSPSRNFWDANYWDNWNGVYAKYIPGFFGFNFDRHPVEAPYEIEHLELMTN